LQLYIDKILNHIVETPGAEHLLSINDPTSSNPASPNGREEGMVQEKERRS